MLGKDRGSRDDGVPRSVSLRGELPCPGDKPAIECDAPGEFVFLENRGDDE